MLLNHVKEQDLVLSTTGMISRELFAIEDRPGNFYMIGSMGLVSALGLGLGLLLPSRRIFIVEGDGSALMSLGTLPLITAEAPENLVHVILDNEAYESTGRQPSISSQVSLAEIARASGYRSVAQIEAGEALGEALSACAGSPGPHLLLVKVGIAPVEGLPRVSHSPTYLRDRLQEHIKRCSGEDVP